MAMEMVPMLTSARRLRRSWIALLFAAAAIVTLPISGVLHELGHLPSSAAKGGAPQGKITDACDLCAAFSGAGHGLTAAWQTGPHPAGTEAIPAPLSAGTAPAPFTPYRERAPPEFLRRR